MFTAEADRLCGLYAVHQRSDRQAGGLRWVKMENVIRKTSDCRSHHRLNGRGVPGPVLVVADNRGYGSNSAQQTAWPTHSAHGRSASVGYLSKVAMPSWNSLCDSAIGTGACHRPLRAASSGSPIKAPGFADGFAGGYLHWLARCHYFAVPWRGSCPSASLLTSQGRTIIMDRLVTITIAMLLAGALAANAQTWRGAEILHKQAENFTPIEKAA
jgi:hypothetical protein